MPLHHCISTKETSDKKQAKHFFPEVTEKKLAIKNPELITVLNTEKFFQPNPANWKSIFNSFVRTPSFICCLHSHS